MKLDFKLSVVGIGELEQISTETPSHIVSLVDPGTQLPEWLALIPHANRLVLYVHDAFDSTETIRAPNRGDAVSLCNFADAVVEDTISHLVVHCHMGRSRSAASAAILLVRLGCSPQEAFQSVRSTRDPIWPNLTLLEHGDLVLGCQGRLLEEANSVYVDVQTKYPAWVNDPLPDNIPL